MTPQLVVAICLILALVPFVYGVITGDVRALIIAFAIAISAGPVMGITILLVGEA